MTGAEPENYEEQRAAVLDQIKRVLDTQEAVPNFYNGLNAMPLEELIEIAALLARGAAPSEQLVQEARDEARKRKNTIDPNRQN